MGVLHKSADLNNCQIVAFAVWADCNEMNGKAMNLQRNGQKLKYEGNKLNARKGFQRKNRLSIAYLFSAFQN